MYNTNHMFPVLPIKNLVNHDGETSKPHKLATGTKPLVSKTRVLFCACVVRKSTAHIDTNTLNMHHQSKQNWGIFVVIPQHQSRNIRA